MRTTLATPSARKGAIIDGGAMISVELWRARIGLFNSKRYSAGSSSSLFLLSFVSFKFHRRRKRHRSSYVDTREKPLPTAASHSPPPYAPPISYPSSTSSPAAEETLIVSSLQQSLPSLSFLRGVILLIAIIYQVLMTSGDVETNPGPLACK